ncbi:Protein Wnt-3a [Hypsibius exemplaris]|uniref:Protein Wnt n=1 Tax=Hypsibius exemplaris TaxID=2072580 RepID=A0A1W0WRG7_HYPEX|nr:Protein Wnt-3a [Hypsibius exemplaris]
MNLLIWLTILALVRHTLSTPGTSWWLLGASSTVEQLMRDDVTTISYKAICQNQMYLVDKQKDLCSTDRNILKTVAEGAALGISECQHQFAGSRWNCPIATNSTSLFGPVLTVNSREKAYVHAISAAGVAYSVTRGCSQGDISDCGCDKRIKYGPTDGTFEWGGCSDDINFGEKFSREFVDAKETKRTAESLMNIHNNEAGRKHLRDNLQRMCKCHGVSGSCSIRICWRKLPDFRKVGDSLSRKFEGAHMVRMNVRKGRLRPRHRGQKYPTKNDLVYIDQSPNYCDQNSKYGIAGTRGRSCNETSNGIDGCSLLCCGRGYRTMVKEEEKDCRCKFVWCCNVKCERCIEHTEEHICN